MKKEFEFPGGNEALIIDITWTFHLLLPVIMCRHFRLVAGCMKWWPQRPWIAYRERQWVPRRQKNTIKVSFSWQKLQDCVSWDWYRNSLQPLWRRMRGCGKLRQLGARADWWWQEVRIGEIQALTQGGTCSAHSEHLHSQSTWGNYLRSAHEADCGRRSTHFVHCSLVHVHHFKC